MSPLGTAGSTHTGANLNETILTPLNVGAAGGFGVAVYAQPGREELFAAALRGWGQHLPARIDNVVYVATEHDGVYAFDADDVAGTHANPLWYDSLIPSGMTTVPSGDLGSGDVAPEVGITATPVIDPTTNTLYTVTKVKRTSDSAYLEYLHALDIATGTEKFGGPVQVTASFAGLGAGESVKGSFSLDIKRGHIRAALVLYNGIVYVTFASHADVGTWHGVILGYNASNLSLVKKFIATPNGFGAGIWQSGAGPAIDGAGNMFFCHRQWGL